MVFRAYTEKKPGLSPQAGAVLADLRDFVGIRGLEEVRILHRYDIEGITPEVYRQARRTVLSEPQVDYIWDEHFEDPGEDWHALAVEPLPGQYDQRADSLSQCIAMMTGEERPAAASAIVYLLRGKLLPEDMAAAAAHLINPVESRQALPEKPETLKTAYQEPEMVKTMTGFITLSASALSALRRELGLAMDDADLAFLQAYFRDSEKRDPTITEIRVVDTYWSDHCRHTTFGTRLQNISIARPEVKAAWNRYLKLRTALYPDTSRPVTLMDIATIGAKYLKKDGRLPELDESEEINACSIHVPAVVDGEVQDWLLMFKNETHNHPTEIEPFGGAATCIGGCIRDPLSGRAYVHQAMRVTGCADPRQPYADTPEGKLPQRYIARTAAEGYSSYGNQIGLATGHVAEVYHPGYAAKHLETGAVVGAVRASRVRREAPAPGDIILLVGGRTGRDGIGGATGSSKTHDLSSLSAMASEVQRGNAPEERKLQRLFRDPQTAALIKRCNDFGAGGVAVAVGELADGLEIDLDAVRKKYAGLDGTEIAISESQERMAVVVDREDADAFIAAAAKENLEAYPVAVVKEEPRMTMKWRGKEILNLARAFLNTNGAVRHADVTVEDTAGPRCPAPTTLRETAASLPAASRRGLTERFDSTVGAGSVLMPYGGDYQRTPAQVMAALLPVMPDEHTSQASLMSWGFDPQYTASDPYGGAYTSVLLSLAKIVAAGGDWKKAYLTFQEFFPRLGSDPVRWGQPLQALLGALDAQLTFGRPAIGGKDSMSGSFLGLDVPPTLISFAVAPADAGEILTPEFKAADHPVYVFGGKGTDPKAAWDAFLDYTKAGKVAGAWAVERAPAEAVIHMSFGNRVGFCADAGFDWWTPAPGIIVAEFTEEIQSPHARLVGKTVSEPRLTLGEDEETVADLLRLSEDTLADVYPLFAPAEGQAPRIVPQESRKSRSAVHYARPRVVIPVFPGTNCEYDSARACLDAGLDPEILVIRTLTPADFAASAQALEQQLGNAQILFLPGGFSGGDEPEGSAKFMTALLRSPGIKDAVHDLLHSRGGLILGICNGFQALIKTGLVPYGEIRALDDTAPTLTYNAIGRHQSMIVGTRIASGLSPWLSNADPEAVYKVPISHGEGRFIASETMLEELRKNGQIATQYVTLDGEPSMDTAFNPNGSLWAVEGLTSPDGRVLGKMGHSERTGEHLYKNVPGNYNMGLFASAAEYFS